jgi:ankyrin repeat protein
MNYNTSETSEMNNIDFLESDTDNGVSITSPFSLNSDNRNTLIGGNNYSATSPFSLNSDNGNTLIDGNNYSASQNQTGGFWPFSSPNKKLLYIALLEKNPEASIFLAKHLDDICQKKHGKTVLHYIAHEYNSIPNVRQIVSAILSRNDVRKFINTTEDHSGDTALHIATRNGNYEFCSMLINAGANPKIKNNDGLYIVSETEPEVMISSRYRVIDNMGSQMSHSSSESNEKYVKNLLDVFLNLNNKNKQYTETEMSMPSRLSINNSTSDTYEQQSELFEGGYDSNLLNTEQFVDQLLQKYNNLNDSESTIMNGGNRKTLIGTRKMTTLSDMTLSGGKSSDESDESDESDDDSETELSRLIKRQSDEIHDRTVKKIMDLMNVDEKTAKNYKAALYRKVKESRPELNNLDRAVEMEKLATKTELKKIDIKKVTKEIEEHISKKQSERESSDTPKENKKASKSKGKKALSVTSPTSVPSESSLSITSEY